MKIAIGCDHAGFEFKEVVKSSLEKRGVEIQDFGCHGHESVDYPDFAEQVAKYVSEGQADQGVLICGTGIGMSMMANKFSGVRAALVHNVFTAKMSRAHNNANVLVLGAKSVEKGDVEPIISEWLSTPFEGGRHERRVDKINKADQGK